MCSACSGDYEYDDTPEPEENDVVCATCNDEGIVMTSPAGAQHEDDLPEYVPCPDCRGSHK